MLGCAAACALWRPIPRVVFVAFNREEALGMHLDIPAGAAVRFEPGEQKTVRLVPARRRRTAEEAS